MYESIARDVTARWRTRGWEGGCMGIKGQAWRRNKFFRGASVSGRDNGNVNGSGRDL